FAAAEKIWKARTLVLEYLRAAFDEPRSEKIGSLHEIEWTDSSKATRKVDLDTVTRIAKLLPPPLHDEEATPGKRKMYNVVDDDNAVPTEYAVLLPPEYHPLRSYPAVAALHGSRGKATDERLKNA